MDVLSVEEAWAVAKGIVGDAELIGSSTSYYGSVAQLMQANGWTAVTKGSEVLYYTRPAQIALETGVKTYTEVATVSNVAVAESGAVTSATATTTGIGVSVAQGAIACASAACFGYNVGTQIYEANPEWWDGLLAETDEWIVENVPEGGVDAIVTVLEGVDTVLTFPSSLLERIKSYSIESGVYETEADIEYNVPTSAGATTVTFGPISPAYAQKSLQTAINTSTGSVKKTFSLLLNYMTTIYPTVIGLVRESGIKYNVIDCYTDANDRIGYCSISFNFYNVESQQILSYNSSLGYYFTIDRSTINPGFSVTVSQEFRDDFFNPNYSTSKPTAGSYLISVGGRYGYYAIFTELVLNNVNATSISEKSEVDGTSKQDDAIYPSINTPISELYPDWWNRRVTIDNGEGGSTDWLPVSITDKIAEEMGDDQTQEEAQSGTKTDVDNNTNIEVKVDEDSKNDDKITNPDSTDTGDTPLVFPSTSIFGIAGVYNPTLDQIKSFTGWLWSENPITQLQQMFSNPMNAIIGLHLIYATPSTSAEKTIGVGYLDSGVLSKVVSEQYVTINCGTVTIPSYYNNVNDWNPYTKISCYLPFIGIVKLNTDDLMSSNGNLSQLNITYKVDVLTGACLAMLKVNRGSSNAILYQFNGSCSVQLPLTSGNYGGIIASLITTAVGVVSGFTPLAVGGAMSLTHPKAEIQRSGQLGANVGAMGIKKPYLIIERPYSKYASSYAKHIGYPSNNTLKLSACKGFTRVKSTDVNNINTTEEERKMILNLLTNGIYI